MTTWPPRRVRVVGTSGAGKTTFARALARRLGVPHRELDEVFWAPDWQMRDLAEAQGVLRDFLAASPGGWVVDGNWNTRREGLADDADVVVWLDYARPLVMARVVRRTLGRGLLRRELWHGNREQLRNLVRRDPEENIVLWAWTSHARNREQYAAEAARGTVPVVRLRSPRAARRWLTSLPVAGPAPRSAASPEIGA
ncbi:toxin [Cellulomonas hominis]|uniref:Toxin n=1 Tax=Cellulomonas hominis TaxID=156981 RepID=A0A7Z8K081_9CELL|nr:toxin [Cellulomonas hominis]TKR24503.1 toxin [Cellulomonas hominis]